MEEINKPYHKANPSHTIQPLTHTYKKKKKHYSLLQILISLFSSAVNNNNNHVINGVIWTEAATATVASRLHQTSCGQGTDADTIQQQSSH